MKNAFILIVLLALLTGSTTTKEPSSIGSVYNQEFRIDGVKYYWVWKGNNSLNGEVVCPAKDIAIFHATQIIIRGSLLTDEMKSKMIDDIFKAQ